MSKSDLVKILGGVVVGAVLSGALAFSVFDIRLRGDTESGINLSPGAGGACVVSGKETEVRVRQGRRVIWKIRNYCLTGQTVNIGNVRTNPTSTATNCSNATDGSLTYPFEEQTFEQRSSIINPGTEQPDHVNPANANLRLKVTNGAPVQTYYFDICLGGQKADPRLIVER
jgi:hypothetical protein